MVGCFMLTNLTQLISQLLDIQEQLQGISKHWCHHGVAEHLSHVQTMQQDVLGTVQVGIWKDHSIHFLSAHLSSIEPALHDKES